MASFNINLKVGGATKICIEIQLRRISSIDIYVNKPRFSKKLVTFNSTRFSLKTKCEQKARIVQVDRGAYLTHFPNGIATKHKY